LQVRPDGMWEQGNTVKKSDVGKSSVDPKKERGRLSNSWQPQSRKSIP
jgi:hypothetical protein